MTTTLRSKFSKASTTILLAAMFVQFAPAAAMAQYASWWNLGWTSRTTYRPLLGGYRTTYYPTYAPAVAAPVYAAPVVDNCSTCQPACSTCYRPVYSYAPTVAYRPVTYYRPLSVPMVSYYQPGCSSCGSHQVVGSACSSCGTSCNTCGTSSYVSDSCSNCSSGVTYSDSQPYSEGQLAPVPSNGSQSYPAPVNGSQTPQPSLAPSEAPRSIYAPSEDSRTQTFQKPLIEEAPAAPYPAEPESDPATSTPRLRPVPTRSSTRGLFGDPEPAPEQDKTASVERSVSRVVPATHTIAEPRRLNTTQEELDAAGWRSAR